MGVHQSSALVLYCLLGIKFALNCQIVIRGQGLESRAYGIQDVGGKDISIFVSRSLYISVAMGGQDPVPIMPALGLIPLDACL